MRKRAAQTALQHLKDLASALAGAGWRKKFPNDWTPEEREAYRLWREAHPAEGEGWFHDFLDTPITMTTIDHWRCGRYSFMKERWECGPMTGTHIHLVGDPAWSDWSEDAPYERPCMREEIDQIAPIMAPSRVAELRAVSALLEGKEPASASSSD